MDLSKYLKTAKQIMANPTPPANATLRIRIANHDPIIDYDALGNPIVRENTQKEVSLRCWLRQAKPPAKDVQPGTNLDSEYFEGELLDPFVYDGNISSLGFILVTINGIKGKFNPTIFLDSPTSYGVNIRGYHGQKIAGYIEFTTD
jgi:hypothetical protein